MKTDAQIIDEIIRREGSKYTDHPADRGGPTKYGITRATLQRYRNRTRPGVSVLVTAFDVQHLTEDQARTIYRDMFVVWPGFDRITNPALRGLVVDSGVQHGPDDPIAWLQTCAGVKVDGKFGPISAAAVNALPVRDVYAFVLAQRCMYYGELVTDDPVRVSATKAGYRTQAENAKGWARRLGEFITETRVL
jgi:lysozyme family protein